MCSCVDTRKVLAYVLGMACREVFQSPVLVFLMCGFQGFFPVVASDCSLQLNGGNGKRPLVVVSEHKM